MDNIILANNALDMVLQTFNSLHKRLQFTIEIEKEKQD